ncbi:hypothetical protein PT2222_60130 [Paraburkholderia tropica]
MRAHARSTITNSSTQPARIGSRPGTSSENHSISRGIGRSLFRGCRGCRIGDRRFGAVAAAERAHQLRPGVEPLRLHLREVLLLQQLRVLRGQHVEEFADAAAIAFVGEPPGGARGVERCFGAGLLGLERAHRNGLHGDVAHRVDDRAVIGVHRGIARGNGHAVLAASASTVEDRQRDRRAHAMPDAVAVDEVEEAAEGRRRAERGGREQVDVGIEVGMRGVDTLLRREHAPARRDHVRAMADELRGQRGRQRERHAQRERRSRERVAVTGALARERGNREAIERDLLLGALQSRRAGRELRLRLSGFETAADARVPALRGDVEGAPLLLLDRGVGVGERVIERELHVGAHHAGLQFDFGETRVGGARMQAVECARADRALLAPQIEVVSERRADAVAPDRRAAGRRGRGVARVAAALEFAVDARLRQRARARYFGLEARGVHARREGLEVGIARRGVGDHAVELRVVPLSPPVAARPLRVGLRRAQGRAWIERRGVEHRRLPVDAAAVDAAAQQAGGCDGGHHGQHANPLRSLRSTKNVRAHAARSVRIASGSSRRASSVNWSRACMRQRTRESGPAGASVAGSMPGGSASSAARVAASARSARSGVGVSNRSASAASHAV